MSDLDGTLLQNNQTVSDYTKRAINELVSRGMLFTFATARSMETADIVTNGLKISAPCVLYNGVFVRDIDNSIILSHLFAERDKNIVSELISAGIFPIVYSIIGGREKFSFIAEKLNHATAEFIKTRKECARYNPVQTERELLYGDMFYITCMGEAEKLTPFYNRYKNEYYCVYSNDIYSGEQWLEILPKRATKANALCELKKLLDCRLVVFGDGKNDIEMFGVADECYAMENAVDELKAIATEVIKSNNSDGVAKQLLKLYKS